MRVLSVVGARPQFIKAAPIFRAALELGIDHQIVHTGQHYDATLSENIFLDMGIPSPIVNLDVGSGTHSYQTSEIMRRIEKTFEEHHPDWVLVYGDTNSTLAAALVAVQMNVKTAHIESGLRSFDKSMPEEINRVITDHVTDLLFAPTQGAMNNLSNEGLGDRSILVGDVMYDAILWQLERNRSAEIAIPELVPQAFYLVTIHRPENTDHRDRLHEVIQSLKMLDYPSVIPAHPRLVKQLEVFGISTTHPNLILIEPPNHSQLIEMVRLSRGVITDSGGLQKETFFMGIKCTTVRRSTEWLETLEDDWNILLPDLSHLLETATRTAPKRKPLGHFGDGSAALLILKELLGTSN
jgi:UDP-N-acetylglucosamine 2-epimerase (non-hydrolysing)